MRLTVLLAIAFFLSGCIDYQPKPDSVGLLPKEQPPLFIGVAKIKSAEVTGVFVVNDTFMTGAIPREIPYVIIATTENQYKVEGDNAIAAISGVTDYGFLSDQEALKLIATHTKHMDKWNELLAEK